MDLSTAATASSSSSVTVSRLSVVPPQQRHVHVQQRQTLLQVNGVATNAAATTTELKSRPLLVTPHAVVPPVAVSEHLSVRPPQYDGDMRPQVRRNAET